MKTTAGIIGLIAFSANAAHANETSAGTTVENTFTLEYEIGGVAQGTITNDPDYTGDPADPQPVINPGGPTGFTVDRLVDLSITADNSGLQVPPNSQDRTLQFTVTNLGNDHLSYSFSLADVAGDDFDATGLELTYSRDAHDLNDDGDTDDACEAAIVNASLSFTPLGAAAGDASYTCDIPKDLPFTVHVSADIPDSVSDTDTDEFVVIVEARNPLAWAHEASAPTPGAVVEADVDGSNTIGGSAENFLADGSGSTEETSADGLLSVSASFTVSSAELTALKTVWVLDSVSDRTSCNSEAIPASEPTSNYPAPGACVLYSIQVLNSGETAGVNADGIDIVDPLPDGVAFVSASASGFTSSGTLTSKKADSTTDCDGSDGETCTVKLTGASLQSVAGSTKAEANLFIKALVR
ncbi:hypothetical protein [Henriciella sp.]|uniref:hypothetical protein n=1 Tax=Henriciella sp. TaxID=1968823 RepID=UPI002638119C|nr:hypothetical protein [Henriciella sp.]